MLSNNRQLYGTVKNVGCGGEKGERRQMGCLASSCDHGVFVWGTTRTHTHFVGFWLVLPHWVSWLVQHLYTPSHAQRTLLHTNSFTFDSPHKSRSAARYIPSSADAACKPCYCILMTMWLNFLASPFSCLTHLITNMCVWSPEILIQITTCSSHLIATVPYIICCKVLYYPQRCKDRLRALASLTVLSRLCCAMVQSTRKYTYCVKGASLAEAPMLSVWWPVINVCVYGGDQCVDVGCACVHQWGGSGLCLC